MGRLFPSWTCLTEYEQAYALLCIAPARRLVGHVLAAGGRTHVVALDARITDLPAFADARVTLTAEDRRTHDAIGGLTDESDLHDGLDALLRRALSA